MKTKNLSAVFLLKNERRHHVLRFNFSANGAKLTCCWFCPFEKILLFAGFHFDSERHPRKLPAAPAPSNSALATLHLDNERFIGEEFSDSMTARTIFVRKQYSLEYSGASHMIVRATLFGLQLSEKFRESELRGPRIRRDDAK